MSLRAPHHAGASARRRDGYLPIRDYAVLGDGRTVALVGIDGSIDWLCVPDLDSPSVFGAIVDAGRGGRFTLSPAIPFDAERRYLPDTNVLETTFHTDAGSVRVTEAMTLPRGGLAPQRELLRRIEGLSGQVPMRWTLAPRFGYGSAHVRVDPRRGLPVAAAGSDAVGVRSWDAGEPRCDEQGIDADFEIAAGGQALLAMSASHGEPLVFPGREQAEARLDATAGYWRSWAADRTYEGPWRDAVIRSVLALKLLVFAPSGAIAAAATTSLPAVPGGERNWDYRFSWIRDAVFTIDAFLALGCPAEARGYFSWLLHASARTHPRLRVLYRLGGGTRCDEQELSLEGYRGARPVRIGNAAAPQLQLDVYGELMQTAHRYADQVGSLDAETGRRLAAIADEVCKLWREPDAGIWESRSEHAHFTQSKLMCWLALDCAASLAAEGNVPDRHADRWHATAEQIAAFIESECWSERARSYTRAAGDEDLDASLVFAVLMGYRPSEEARLDLTLGALRRELGDGPLLYRYRAHDGMAGEEGAFLACSFWLAQALARRGRLAEAQSLMEELLALGNDVGLYAEQIDPDGGAFLGNFPQGLVHLALINAAVECAEAGQG